MRTAQSAFSQSGLLCWACLSSRVGHGDGVLCKPQLPLTDIVPPTTSWRVSCEVQWRHHVLRHLCPPGLAPLVAPLLLPAVTLSFVMRR